MKDKIKEFFTKYRYIFLITVIVSILNYLTLRYPFMWFLNTLFRTASPGLVGIIVMPYLVLMIAIFYVIVGIITVLFFYKEKKYLFIFIVSLVFLNGIAITLLFLYADYEEAKIKKAAIAAYDSAVKEASQTRLELIDVTDSASLDSEGNIEKLDILLKIRSNRAIIINNPISEVTFVGYDLGQRYCYEIEYPKDVYFTLHNGVNDIRFSIDKFIYKYTYEKRNVTPSGFDVLLNFTAHRQVVERYDYRGDPVIDTIDIRKEITNAPCDQYQDGMNFHTKSYKMKAH